MKNRPVVNPAAEVTPLFRDSARLRTGQQLPGPVSVIAPPAFAYTLLIALLCVALLAIALYLIEIPLRSRAVGVLMPTGGILDVAAASQGRVAEIAVAQGQTVVEGQLLIALSSDRGSRNIPSLTASQLHSLESELTIVGRKKDELESLRLASVNDLKLRLATMLRRRDLANRESEVISARVALLASRVRRLESLKGRGGIAKDRIEQLRLEFLSAKRDALVAERTNVGLDLEMRQFAALSAKTNADILIQSLEADSMSERLHRLIDEKTVEQGQRILSPGDGEVIRLGVAVGAVVAAGKTLLSLAADTTELEAWLYVSAQEAGILKRGQEIELRLDAYPHQLFGTVSAVVSSVTRLAVLPRDVHAPIAVAGPVFEVRAIIPPELRYRLDPAALPGVGASFTADIIRARYRLYEWLLRSRASSGNPESA